MALLVRVVFLPLGLLLEFQYKKSFDGDGNGTAGAASNNKPHCHVQSPLRLVA